MNQPPVRTGSPLPAGNHHPGTAGPPEPAQAKTDGVMERDCVEERGGIWHLEGIVFPGYIESEGRQRIA